MKLLKIVYFHIYNTYYKDGNYSNDIPHLTAYGIVGCSISVLFTTIVLLILKLFTTINLAYSEVIIIMILSLIFFLYFFLFNRKYDKIYKEIKDTNLDTLPFKILSWIIIAVSFFSIVFYTYIFNQPD